MAQDLYQLKAAFSNHHQVAHYESFKILCQVFNQQCQVNESQPGEPEILIKEKPDKDALCTPHDPETRYVRKGKQRVTGDKAAITETCDQENQTQFLLDVGVHAANHYDGNDQDLIQQRLTANKFKTEQQYCDVGFVNGQTILNSEKNGITLEGPTPGHSQTFESYSSANRPFDATDFKVNYDQDTRTMAIQNCPLGQIPINQHRSIQTKEILVYFDPRICRACDQVARCPVKIGTHLATWKVLENKYVSARAIIFIWKIPATVNNAPFAPGSRNGIRNDASPWSAQIPPPVKKPDQTATDFCGHVLQCQTINTPWSKL